MSGKYFGWDIGGAHLKVAQLAADGEVIAVRQIASPLWRGLDALEHACTELDLNIRADDCEHAITMTGELCDIFPDRVTGVRQIVATFLTQVSPDAQVRVFGGRAGWLDPRALEDTAAASVASANWLALATFAAERIGDGVLIDIGSTTTDIIPIQNGMVCCQGKDDAGRLMHHELAYTGIVRTPVIGICSSTPYRGRAHPLAAEVFATMADAYRLLGRIGPGDDQMPTADGGEKTVAASARRLARMLGRDYLPSEAAEMRAVAGNLARQQRRNIDQALEIVLSRAPDGAHAALLVGSGLGRFVVEQLARDRGVAYRDLGALIDAAPALASDVARAAPAVAVARLAWMGA